MQNRTSTMRALNNSVKAYKFTVDITPINLFKVYLTFEYKVNYYKRKNFKITTIRINNAK